MQVSILASINILGTLILAAIAVSAIIIPLALNFYYRPRFQIDLRGIEFNDELGDWPELRFSISNIGRRVAHGCKVLVNISSQDDNELDNLYLPWIWEDPNNVNSGPSDYKDWANENKDVTYVPITLYPHESASVKFLFYAETDPGDLNTAFRAIFGATNTWHYYPSMRESVIHIPPLTERHPSISHYVTSDEQRLEENILYSASVSVFSEERTYWKLKKFYFILKSTVTIAGVSKTNLDVEI
ncbi:MAG: hypothetical protein JRN15_18895 [Nitrososphaerota archaeon]|nr:hypothetical protein [Nitrososphaerota archaeon]